MLFSALKNRFKIGGKFYSDLFCVKSNLEDNKELNFYLFEINITSEFIELTIANGFYNNFRSLFNLRIILYDLYGNQYPEEIKIYGMELIKVTHSLDYYKVRFTYKKLINELPISVL